MTISFIAFFLVFHFNADQYHHTRSGYNCISLSNISDSVRKELEFDKVLNLLEAFAKSSENKKRIKALSILHSPKVLNYHLDCLQEYCFIESDSNFPKFGYNDLHEVIMYLKIKAG